jgi:hypothetical protein
MTLDRQNLGMHEVVECYTLGVKLKATLLSNVERLTILPEASTTTPFQYMPENQH